MFRGIIGHTGLACVAICALAPVAAAQTAQPGAGQGPLVLERVESGFMIAPDVKATDIDGEFGALAGAYGGWVIEKTLLVGAGGYWLANGSDDLEMAYGGLVVEWLARTDRSIGFGARGLIGGGQATLSDTRTIAARFGGRNGRNPASEARDIRFRFEETFLVFEPQLNVLLNLTKHIRVNVGAGYRVTGYTRGAGDRLNGPSGSIAVQFGG